MAQSNSAVIVGTVSDSTAAAIVGAKVTVENQGTNISTTVTTKSDGQYTVTNLDPGLYRVTAASAGFAEKSIRDINLFVNQTVRVDVSLEVGAVLRPRSHRAEREDGSAAMADAGRMEQAIEALHALEPGLIVGDPVA